MADTQQQASTPSSKIVILDDIKAIADTGQRLAIHITTKPGKPDQNKTELQIEISTEGNSEPSKTSNDSCSIKHTGRPYDSRALVKQLQSLQLDDDDIVDQILSSSQPTALSELSAAHNSKSMIPLVTAEDGRVFSIAPGQPAYKDWARRYPMGYSRAPSRKLGDPALANDKITVYQTDKLREILAAVCNTEDSREFRQPVQVLHAEVREEYMEVIPEPVDLSTMRHMLFHNRYATMAGFRRHVDLLESNARRYNRKRAIEPILTAAANVKNDIYRRMDETPAEPPFIGDNLTQILQIVHSDGEGRTIADGSKPADDDDSDSNENQDASFKDANKSDVWTIRLCLPLGRLCVARDAGSDEAFVTPYIVVMNPECLRKSLWLIKDNFTPCGLPDDKRILLDFGGRYNFETAQLTDNISEWRARRRPTARVNGHRVPNQGRNGTQAPSLSWADVEKLISQTSQGGGVLFDTLDDHRQAAAAIKVKWSRSTESSVEESIDKFVVGVEDSRDSDYDEPQRRSKRKRGPCYYVDEYADDTSDE